METKLSNETKVNEAINAMNEKRAAKLANEIATDKKDAMERAAKAEKAAKVAKAKAAKAEKERAAKAAKAEKERAAKAAKAEKERAAKAKKDAAYSKLTGIDLKAEIVIGENEKKATNANCFAAGKHAAKKLYKGVAGAIKGVKKLSDKKDVSDYVSLFVEDLKSKGKVATIKQKRNAADGFLFVCNNDKELLIKILGSYYARLDNKFCKIVNIKKIDHEDKTKSFDYTDKKRGSLMSGKEFKAEGFFKEPYKVNDAKLDSRFTSFIKSDSDKARLYSGFVLVEDLQIEMLDVYAIFSKYLLDIENGKGKEITL